MKKMTLKPIEPKDSWSIELRRQILQVFFDGIYKDLLEVIKLPMTNSGEYALIRAIKSGDIRYLNGKFSGQFNAAISKQLREYGATFDARSKTWNVLLSSLPQEVDIAIAVAARNVGVLQTIMDTIISKTSERVSLLLKGTDLSQFANVTADKIDEQFKRTVSDAIGVQPELSPIDAIRLDETYVKSMTRPIKKVIGAQARLNIDDSVNKFSDEEVVKLREEVREWVKSGKSRKGLADMINARLKVGKDRAKFIARQETALFTAEFKQAQYQAAGIKKYIWDATADSRTRPRHRELDGKEFSWDNPPVTDLKTQSKNHPGEDFNCRCQARPVVEFE